MGAKQHVGGTGSGGGKGSVIDGAMCARFLLELRFHDELCLASDVDVVGARGDARLLTARARRQRRKHTTKRQRMKRGCTRRGAEKAARSAFQCPGEPEQEL
eukprot:3204553-Rhodomonas_salina.2